MRQSLVVALAAAVVALAALVAVPRLRRRAPEGERPPGGGAALLREKVLTREFLAGVAPAEDGRPRCVLMDWNLGGNDVATLAAFDDGTTSLYFSSGGGVIGAGAHEAVKRAAAGFRDEAGRALAHFSPVSRFDPPPPGTSVFYIVTDSATLASEPIENAWLQGGEHALSALARSAQDVITQIRRST